MVAAADSSVRTVAGQQGATDDIETQAWECDKWPGWLDGIVEDAMEVADKLDMSTEQAIAYAVLSVRASPSQVAPANPAQVTDARYDSVALEAAREIMTLTRSGVFDDRLKAKIQVRITEAITAAIGAGGQAVAKDIETQAWECDKWPAWLDAIVERTNDVADRLDMSTEQAFAYAVLSALSQPHPAETKDENVKNVPLRADNSTGIPGVFQYPKSGKWYSRIKSGGRVIHLGQFDSFEKAAIARKAAEMALGFHPNHGSPKRSSNG